MDVQGLISETNIAKSILKQEELGNGDKFEDRLRFKLHSNTTDLGRNFFKGDKGYMGVGLQGNNKPGSKEPAVQVGDFFVIL